MVAPSGTGSSPGLPVPDWSGSTLLGRVLPELFGWVCAKRSSMFLIGRGRSPRSLPRFKTLKIARKFHGMVPPGGSVDVEFIILGEN